MGVMAAGALVAMGALVSACGSDEMPPTAIASLPTAATTDAAAPAADTPVTADDRCTDDELSLNPGRTEGSAGSTTVPLVFANTGDRECVLEGFPGVSYVTDEGGTEVGAAASRTGPAGDAVYLQPGSRAAAVVQAVQVLNYPTEDCEPTPVAGLRVYAPNASAARFVALPGTGCALPAIDQLQVTAVSTR